VTWREGTRGAMRSRFARLRVRPAHRDEARTTPRAEEWLLIEWPRGAAAPTKYWLSTLPATMTLAALVRLAKLRWRIERDYQELKDELGLDHFEGRGWRGFHHHGALCIAAYAYLAAERARLSPPAPLAFLRPARLPKGFTPRGAPGPA
jgi:SRSO17 transposase